MNFINNIQNVYISVEPCDLRKGIDGYASLDGKTRWISPDEIVDEFSGYKRHKG